MRVGLYARVSREEQAAGYSLDEQLAAMRAFCAARGWDVAGEYIEPGVTGTTRNRPAFLDALADCEAGRLDMLITHQLDRFYRNLKLQLDTLEALGRWGVGYVSVTEQIDYSTPQGALFLSMLGGFNEYYVANLSRETRKGKQGRAKAGKTNASTIPFGYVRAATGEPVVDPQAAAVVRLAFERYATGERSDTDLAAELNRSGAAPSGRAASGRWTREAVRYVLTNSFYTGLVRHGDDLYPGQHEPIIDAELFERVQAIRRRKGGGRSAGRRPVTGRVYLLWRLARCADCGLPLISLTCGKRPVRSYQCGARRRGYDCAAAGKVIRADLLEAQIADLVARIRLPADWRGRLEALAAEREGVPDPARQRAHLQEKARRLRELYLDGEYSRAEYDRRRAEIRTGLAELEIPDRAATLQAGELLAGFGATWAAAPERLQAEMLRTIFESVVVDMRRRRLVCVRPWPVFAPLFRLDGLKEREGCFYVEREAEARSED